jgi:hypothetical protein
MQKFLYFEIATAIKDRPRIFQFVTLTMFALTLTMVFIGTIVRLSAIAPGRPVVKTAPANSYTGFASSSLGTVQLKK